MQGSQEGKRAKLWGSRAHVGANISMKTVIDSPYVNAENCKLYNVNSKRVRNGFVRHLINMALICWPYVLQM